MIALADLIEPNSFLASPFLSAPLLTAARASLANLFAEGPHPDLSTPNGSVLYRAFQLCQKALKRQYAIWGGVAWLCNALAVDSAGLELSGVAKPSADQLGPVSIHPRDRGFIKRARLDDDARSKIFRHTASAEADEALQAIMTDSVGFSISGIESQGDGAPGLLELYQPAAAAAGDTVSWLTNDYHFELDDPGVHASQDELDTYFRNVFEGGHTVDSAYAWLVPELSCVDYAVTCEGNRRQPHLDKLERLEGSKRTSTVHVDAE